MVTVLNIFLSELGLSARYASLQIPATQCVVPVSQLYRQQLGVLPLCCGRDPGGSRHRTPVPEGTIEQAVLAMHPMHFCRQVNIDRVVVIPTEIAAFWEPGEIVKEITLECSWFIRRHICIRQSSSTVGIWYLSFKVACSWCAPKRTEGLASQSKRWKLHCPMVLSFCNFSDINIFNWWIPYFSLK